MSTHARGGEERPVSVEGQIAGLAEGLVHDVGEAVVAIASEERLQESIVLQIDVLTAGLATSEERINEVTNKLDEQRAVVRSELIQLLEAGAPLADILPFYAVACQEGAADLSADRMRATMQEAARLAAIQPGDIIVRSYGGEPQTFVVISGISINAETQDFTIAAYDDVGAEEVLIGSLGDLVIGYPGGEYSPTHGLCFGEQISRQINHLISIAEPIVAVWADSIIRAGVTLERVGMLTDDVAALKRLLVAGVASLRGTARYDGYAVSALFALGAESMPIEEVAAYLFSLLQTAINQEVADRGEQSSRLSPNSLKLSRKVEAILLRQHGGEFPASSDVQAKIAEMITSARQAAQQP